MSSNLAFKNSLFVSNSIKSKLELAEKLMEEVSITLEQAGIDGYSKVFEMEVRSLKELEAQIAKAIEEELHLDPDQIREKRIDEEKNINPVLFKIERKAEVRQGRRMVDLRKKAGMTQLNLAKAMGLSQSEISKYESGNRSFDIAFVNSICSVFKITPQDFLGLK